MSTSHIEDRLWEWNSAGAKTYPAHRVKVKFISQYLLLVKSSYENPVIATVELFEPYVITQPKPRGGSDKARRLKMPDTIDVCKDSLPSCQTPDTHNNISGPSEENL